MGRTVDLITTLDTPPLVYRYVYRAPGQHALARATLGYCGLRTVNVATFGPVVSSTAQQRQAWLAQAYARGARLEQGPLTPVQRQADGLRAWAAGLRLQFYPMTWVAYSMGALINPTGSIARSSYLLGYLVLFLLEAATVFLNDWYDYESDRRNRNASMFSGGSRVLVEERINRQAMRQGIVISLLGTVLALFALLASIPASAATTTLATYAVMSVLALGYTTPPLKLSYRSLGELDVALTHSVGAILTGYVVQGGDWANPLPWLLALPLGIAIFPAILLAGCPDREADAATGKRTLAVVLGKQKAAAVALIATLLAPIAAIGLMIFHPQVADLMTWSVLGGMLHALWLASRLRRFTHVAMPERIDSLLAIALSFILWFCVPPALVLVLR